MVASLDDAMAEEHIVGACVANELLVQALVRSYCDPLSYSMHTSHQVDSKAAIDTSAFLMPVYYELKVSGVPGFHYRHISDEVGCVFLVIRNWHRVLVLMMQVRKDSNWIHLRNHLLLRLHLNLWLNYGL